MIVVKFGGTSIADASAIKRVIEIIKSRSTKNPIVLVSAISYATNILHQAAILAASGINKKLTQAKKAMQGLHKRHLSITDDLISDKQLLNKTKRTIISYFSEVNDMLQGIFLLSELSGQSYAKIVSYGELLSSVIVHAAMTQYGIKNILIDARKFMFTDDDHFHGKANIELIRQKMPIVLNDHIAKGLTVLTQGFIANTEKGIATTFGREGSDYSAALVGMAMNAKEIEIWTDVDGIMTADPKSVRNAKFISHISFAEAAELTAFGAKILHPATIKPAVENNIPVRILNTLNPQHSGSLILRDVESNRSRVKSIAYKREIKLLYVRSNKISPEYEFLKKAFDVLDKNKVAADAMAISSGNVIFTLDHANANVEKIAIALRQFASVDIEDDRSLVCLVGDGLQNIKGLAKKIFQALEDFDITMFAHGASNSSLSFAVKRKELSNIVQILHDEFFAG